MQARNSDLMNIISSAKQFVIPVFQRDYSWTEAQCEQLWKDVLQVGRDGPDRRHFLGSIVYVASGDSSAGFTSWLLVDGQQRLTTLALALTALRDHIHKIDWRGGADDPTVNRVNAYFLKNVEEEGNRQYKLVLRRHDQATLQALLDQTEMPDVASERIRENYDFFMDQMADADPARVYRGIARLVVVDVTLNRADDDPQLIFESLNSTGMDLSQSDLIRNYILMSLAEPEQTRLYDLYWSKIEALFRGSESTFDSFARDYVALKTKAAKQERSSEIYRAFRRFLVDLFGAAGDLEEALKEILRYARYHAAFSLGSDAFPALADALARLRRIVDVPAILVMRLFDTYDRLHTLSEADLLKALGLIESYVFRRAICGEQTRGYWQVFANLAYKVRDDKPLESLMVGVARQRESYRFPTDDDFRRELLERDLYGLRVCPYLLDRLENHGSHEPTDTSQYTVEHIMPQNEKLSSAWRQMLGPDWQKIQTNWLHRLGNLTLTGYNSTYSDRPFAEKKSMAGGFNESSVRLNRSVREQSAWTEEAMKRRGTDLARKALKIWPALVVERSLIDADRHAEMQALAARRDVSKVKMSVQARALFKQFQRRVLEIDSNIIELAEGKSVSYHGPEFFMEVLPRKRRLTLLLPLDFNEVMDSAGIARDATQWKFFANAKYEGGVTLRIDRAEDIDLAMPIVLQAHSIASA